MAWLYVALFLASTLGSRLIVLRRNPALLRERADFAGAEGTKRWDRFLVLIVGLIGPMVMVVIAGLDQRFGWSDLVPTFGQWIAALFIAAGYGMAVWAMVVNPYFSAVVRIQQDRGQVVITTGLYRLVRHPSYAGALVASVAFPIMLDALWALIPAIPMIIAVVIRTKLEDDMLRAELDGYAAYAQATPWRLIPGIW
jgi:protein-S-isoprenylcysteine O-methyltransferase Ste14